MIIFSILRSRCTIFFAWRYFIDSQTYLKNLLATSSSMPLFEGLLFKN